MITYLYKCDECRLEKEIKHSIKEDPEIVCEKCGSSMRRVPFGGSLMYMSMNTLTTGQEYHGEGKERQKGRKDWIKKNPYAPLLPDHL